MAQRPEDEGLSDDDNLEERDLSKMSDFDREVYERRREFERSQNLHRQKTFQPKSGKLKPNSHSTMDGTEGDYDNLNEEQID